MHHRPTAEEKRVIRDCATRSSGCRRVSLEVGAPINLEDPRIAPNVNIALVSNDPDWNDTDLHQPLGWDVFCAGFTFAEGGRAIVDFYVYSLGRRGELETNVTAYWTAGRLVRVEGTGSRTPLWKENV